MLTRYEKYEERRWKNILKDKNIHIIMTEIHLRFQNIIPQRFPIYEMTQAICNYIQFRKFKITWKEILSITRDMNWYGYFRIENY